MTADSHDGLHVPDTGGWPACAEDYVLDAPDDHVNDEWTWKDAYTDDPRPNAGVTCNGRYLPDDPEGTTRKYACLACGLRKVLAIDQPPHHLIRFACPACKRQQKHKRVGRRYCIDNLGDRTGGDGGE